MIYAAAKCYELGEIKYLPLDSIQLLLLYTIPTSLTKRIARSTSIAREGKLVLPSTREWRLVCEELRVRTKVADFTEILESVTQRLTALHEL